MLLMPSIITSLPGEQSKMRKEERSINVRSVTACHAFSSLFNPPESGRVIRSVIVRSAVSDPTSFSTPCKESDPQPIDCRFNAVTVTPQTKTHKLDTVIQQQKRGKSSDKSLNKHTKKTTVQWWLGVAVTHFIRSTKLL